MVIINAVVKSMDCVPELWSIEGDCTSIVSAATTIDAEAVTTSRPILLVVVSVGCTTGPAEHVADGRGAFEYLG